MEFKDEIRVIARKGFFLSLLSLLGMLSLQYLNEIDSYLLRSSIRFFIYFIVAIAGWRVIYHSIAMKRLSDVRIFKKILEEERAEKEIAEKSERLPFSSSDNQHSIKYNQILNQLIIHIEAPEGELESSLIPFLEKFGKLARSRMWLGDRSPSKLHIWESMPDGLKLSVTFRQAHEFLDFFPDASGTEIDTHQFQNEFYNFPALSNKEAIFILLQQAYGMPEYYFGQKINQLCERVRSGCDKAADYDDYSGYAYIRNRSNK